MASYRFLWMDQGTALSAIAIIYVLFSLYLLLTCILLWFKRGHFLFKKNLFLVTVGSALMQWLMCGSHIWKYVFHADFPVSMPIWGNYVFFPLCIVFSVHARGMHILFEVIWTKSIDHPALSHKSTTIDASSAPHKKQNFILRVKTALKSPWFHVWLKNKGAYILCAFLTSAHVLAALVLSYYNSGRELPDSSFFGVFGVENFGVVFSVLTYVIIWCPIMLYYLAGVKDAYGLRKDLQMGVCYALPCYILYSCFRTYQFLQTLRFEIPSFIFLILAMFCLHTSIVTAPLVKTLFWNPEDLDGSIDRQWQHQGKSPSDIVAKLSSSVPISISQRPIPLEQVLNNPALREPFELYSKNAFVYDSVLFHYAVQKFRNQCSANPDTTHVEAKRIYDQYIITGSPCEMNLSYEVVQRINNIMHNKIFWHGMYDEAQEEILRLVGNCTYRNFLYSLDFHVKARYMIPCGTILGHEPITDIHIMEVYSEG